MKAFARVLLRELVSQVSSWNPSKVGNEDEEFEYIDLSAVDQEFKLISRARTLRCADAPSRARQLVQEGDVLVSTVRPNLNGVAMVPPHLDAVTASTGFCVIRVNRAALEPRYVFHWLKSPGFVSTMMAQATGASYPAVSDRIILDSEIPLPPLPEQRRLAAILDKADALRAKRREALAQLDRLAQSIFVEIFGDPVRNDKSWTTKAVSEICELVRGSSPRPQGDPRYFGGPVPRLMVADITRDGWQVTPRIDSLTVDGAKRSRPVKAGTVVMAVSGNVGLVSRLAVDACVHDGFVAFTSLDETMCRSEYLLSVLHYSKSKHEKSKAGAIFINLTTSDIKAMELPVPPLELQHRYVSRLSAVREIETRVVEGVSLMNALFESVQHRAFRGAL